MFVYFKIKLHLVLYFQQRYAYFSCDATSPAILPNNSSLVTVKSALCLVVVMRT